MAENSASGEHWLPDDPITGPEQDNLGRVPFALRVAAIIDDAADSASSVVVGLTGPWGSGKSSTVNLARACLSADRWKVREVNPWGLTGAEAVVTEVLAAIASAVPTGAAQSVREAISRYAALAAPLLTNLPLGGSAAKVVDIAAARLGGDGTVSGQAREVTNALLRLKQPILIVIDDMDRLQPPELLALFKAVRLLGRLPYVHYLLSYDQRTVVELIAATPIAYANEDRAAAFLEKIVTLRMDQPPTRAEQAEGLYDARMRDLLTRLSVMHLTENLQQRLETEHRALLRRVLAEPRAIGRFFTQLYAYLPLVGAPNIDLPDFVAMTLLRLHYPRLYTALSDDRRLLVGSDFIDWDNPLGTWQNLDSKLETLTDTDAPRELLKESLSLLFPLIAKDSATRRTAGIESRRAHRASSEDYVDRYFALTLPDDDIPDSSIDGALNEWLRGTPDEHVQQLRRALLPAPQNRSSYAQTDRVLRRCVAHGQTLTADNCATVALEVARLFTELPEPNVRAAQDWLVDLLARSTPLPITRLVHAVSAPVNRRSSLWPLIRAVTRAAATSTGAGQTSHTWLREAAVTLGETAWTRFIAQLALGDEAPAEPALGYLLHAEENLGRDVTNARLQASIDNGQIRVIDFAARLVNIGSYLNDYRQFITDFDPAEVVVRVGEDRLDRAAPDIREARIQAAYDGVDEYDISWPNLRRYAAKDFNEDQTETVLPEPLPQADEVIVRQVNGRTAPAISAPGQADLLLTVTVWAPAHDASREQLTSGDFDTLSHAWLEALDACGVTAWLKSEAPVWNAPAPTWRTTDSDGSRSQQAQADLVQAESGTTHPSNDDTRSHTVAAVGARVDINPYPVPAGQRFARLLTVEIGFWLAHLDARHRYLPEASTSQPYPAALTLPQVRQLLRTLVSDVMNPRLWPPTAKENDFNLIIVAAAHSTVGIAAVIDLTAASRETRRSTSSSEVVVETPARDNYTDRLRRVTVDPDRLAVTVIVQWLRDNGYRGYEDLLSSTTRGSGRG